MRNRNDRRAYRAARYAKRAAGALWRAVPAMLKVRHSYRRGYA